MRSRYSILIVAALLASVASAELVWDNGLVPNGFNGRAISPPSFPDIRVVDDFSIRGGVPNFGGGFNVIEDAGWIAPENITMEIYEDTGRGPGDVILSYTGPYDRMETGDEYFGRRNYEYAVDRAFDTVDAGDYWIGIRNPDGGGEGTNYWMTSDGGADGPGSDTGWFSLDGGNSFQAAGDGWHHAFVVTEVPEPSTCLLLGLGGLALLRRRS